MGLPENNKLSKAEYTNTQQDWPVKKDTTRNARLFGWWVVLPKALRVDPYFQVLAKF
jgi:hypothetical protein